jgi:hypothetical protein
MAETTTPIPNGVYTSEKLFLKLNTSEFNNHENDINNNGQIAFVDDDDSSFIYAQGIKVGGNNIKVEDLNLSNYATKNYVSSAIGALDASYTAQSGKYISSISQVDGKITNVTHGTLPATPTLSSLGGITSSAVDTKISSAIANLDVSDTAKSGQYVSAVSEKDGKITVTRANLPTVQTVSVDSSKNYIEINETKYTLDISSSGVLSLSPYKESSIGTCSLSELSKNITANGGGDYYVGTTASVSYGIDITSTSQTLTININNTTGNECKLAVSDGSGSYFRQDTAYSKLNGPITINIPSAYIMKDVATQTFSSIPVTWAGAKTYSADTDGEKTFTVYLTEKDKPTKTRSVKQTNINATVTVKAKVPVLYSTDNFTNKTKIQDIVHGNIPSTLAFGAGISKKVTYIAIPKVLGKNISKVATGIGNLAFTKQSATKPISYGGSSLEYYIYVSDAQITLESNATIHLA